MVDLVAQWLAIPLGFCLFVLGVLLLNWSLRFPRAIQRNCWCGRCGYEIRSLDQQLCPECGEAHVVAGVITPGLLIRVRSNMFVLVMGWTLAYGVVVGTAAGIVIPMAESMALAANKSKRIVQTEDVSVVLMSRIEDAVRRSQDIFIKPYENYFTYQFQYGASVRVQGGKILEGSIELKKRSDPEIATLVVDIESGSWAVESGDGARLATGREFSSAAIMALFQFAELDVETPDRRAEIQSIADYVGDALADPTLTLDPPLPSESAIVRRQQSSSTSTTLANPVSVFGWPEGILLAALLGYLIGLVVCIRKRNKLLALGAIS